MKNTKYIATALILSFSSFASIAATQTQNQISTNLTEFGVISASNASTLTDLENMLAKKADATGAKSFTITSTTGDNKMHGTAVIYR